MRLAARNLSRTAVARGYVELDITPETDVRYGAANRLEYVLRPGAAMEREVDIAVLPGKYFCTTQSNVVGLRPSWQLLELPWPVEKRPLATLSEMRHAVSRAPARRITHFTGRNAGTVRLMVAGDHPGLFRETAGVCRTAPSRRRTGGPFRLTPNPLASGAWRAPLRRRRGGRRGPPSSGPAGDRRARNSLASRPGGGSWNRPGDHLLLHADILDAAATESGASAQAGTSEKESVAEASPTAGGYSLVAQVPLSALAVDTTARRFWLEIMVSCVLPGESLRRAITVFHSLRPEESAQMFGRVQVG